MQVSVGLVHGFDDDVAQARLDMKAGTYAGKLVVTTGAGRPAGRQAVTAGSSWIAPHEAHRGVTWSSTNATCAGASM